MADQVKVAVRVRPFNRRELDLGTKCILDMDETQTILNSTRDRKQTKTFCFDHSFWSIEESDPKFAGQEKVFNCLGKDVLDNAFKGYNACIFAYGQTGSGKSYTMMGTVDQKGIIPRLCEQLYCQITSNTDTNFTFKVEVSYIEIYNEKVRDLLCPSSSGRSNLKVREHKVLGPYVDGLTKLVVSSYEDIVAMMVEGNKSRTVAATNMNSESSRSHAVFNVLLNQSEYDSQTDSFGEKVSKISLVDLAGSERANKTGATGERLKEGSNINKSLVTLGIVISSLADQSASKSKKGTFIPYRDSVLTWLLKDNLGGNSKTVMVATISPSSDNYEETLSTLRYADRAKRIVNHAVINEDPNATIIRELREEVERLKSLLVAKTAGKPITQEMIMGISEEAPQNRGDIEEMLNESEKLMQECTMSWEQKEKKTEQIQQERHKALEDMGISIQSSGIAVEKSKFYLVNLNADPSLNELLVYYLKEKTLVGRPDAPHPVDIQLSGLGILPEHCQLEIDGNDVFITQMPNARTCVNGRVISEKTQLHHGDRVLWGNNHFFRINCPRKEGEPAEQMVDYQFAQNELLMNEATGGTLQVAIENLEEQHRADMQGALEKQRQMYEEKIEELRNQMNPRFINESSRSASVSSFSSGYGSRLSWADEREITFDRNLQKLREEVLKANALIREANQISEEMMKDTEFAVTLQIPTSSLSFNRNRPNFSSEVAIIVKHKSRGTQIWSLDKLANKIYDMRDLYQQFEEGEPTDETLIEETDLFFEVECHTLIGVANVFLSCLYHDVNFEYAAPIISQQGEVCGRLKVEITRLGASRTRVGSTSSSGSSSDERDSPSPTGRDIPDVVLPGQILRVEVKVLEATDLPPVLCNYVFCQYKFWGTEREAVIPPINASLSGLGPKTNKMIFDNKQFFEVEVTEDFLEYTAEGSLAIEVWGNRSKGFDSPSKWSWSIEPAHTKGLQDRWNELVRKIELWVEIHEMNDQGVFAAVEVQSRSDNETGGIFMLRQGYSRRIMVHVKPIPKSGSLPLVCTTISGMSIGAVCVRNKFDAPLDSYQEKDLALIKEKWSTSVMRRREYLDGQIQELTKLNEHDWSPVDRERESWLIDQWVRLTEERNAVMVPQPNSGIPGAPCDWDASPGMERNIPVIFLDLSDDMVNGCVDEAGPAGVSPTIVYEDPETMIPLQIIHYDQKNVSAKATWDSSIHNDLALNRVTPDKDRVYVVLKVTVRLSSPLSMDLVLRKRLCVKVYKRQSLKDSIMRRISRENKLTRCGVTYELVSHIPKQSGEETEERATLAQMAAAAMGACEEEDEKFLAQYKQGISHVESILELDKLRQEVVVKEKLAASGKPLRKFASTPNLAPVSDFAFSPARSEIMDGGPLIDFGGIGRFSLPLSGMTSMSQSNLSSGSTLHSHSSCSSGDSEKTPRGGASVSLPINVPQPVIMRNSPHSSGSRPNSAILEPVFECEVPPSPRITQRHEDSFGLFSETNSEVARGIENDILDSPFAEWNQEPRNRTMSVDTVINAYDEDGSRTPTAEETFFDSTDENEASRSRTDTDDSLLTNSEFNEMESDLIRIDETNFNVITMLDSSPSVHSDTVEIMEKNIRLGNAQSKTSDLGDELLSPVGSTSEISVHEDDKPIDGLPGTESVFSEEERVLNDSGKTDFNVLVSEDNPSSEVLDSEPTQETVNETKSKAVPFTIGQAISFNDGKKGMVRYIGSTEFAAGQWIGVELVAPLGKNDGSVNDVKYFTCKQKHGSFYRADRLTSLLISNNTSQASQATRSKKRQTMSGQASSSVQMRSRQPGQKSRKQNELKRRSNIF